MPQLQETEMSIRMPTYFISHGGGPWPWLPAMRAQFSLLERSLMEMVADFPEQPKAILMISGHWEEDTVAVMASPNPPMLYDYSGFPPETYQITYPAPGAPELAQTAMNLLSSAGVQANLNYSQGFDHGTFAPLAIMYPNANVPVFQISLLKSYDPASHFAIGRALAGLRDQGVVIIGSGLSYHNLGMLGPKAKEPSHAFDGWLRNALTLAPQERTKAIENWENAPSARICHPQEDHLVPLFVALGAAEQATTTMIYHEDSFMGGIASSSFRFG
jgi:aromatic ring-opening dioxygenase catalytic subunit (LigB family)